MSNDHNKNNDDRTYEKIQKEVNKMMVSFTSKYILLFENAPALRDVEGLIELYEKETNEMVKRQNKQDEAALPREKIKV